jgi:hypothetical protein
MLQLLYYKYLNVEYNPFYNLLNLQTLLYSCNGTKFKLDSN